MELSPQLEKLIDDTPLNAKLGKGQINDFLDNLVKGFIEQKIADFPRLCLDAMRVNHLHNQEIEANGYKTPTRMIGGKVYEGTSGWSKDGTFKHKWIIPMELQFFMRNLIYINFWEDSNAKVRDSFMKAILRGDDPLELLRKVRNHYGPNTDSVIET